MNQINSQILEAVNAYKSFQVAFVKYFYKKLKARWYLISFPKLKAKIHQQWNKYTPFQIQNMFIAYMNDYSFQQSLQIVQGHHIFVLQLFFGYDQNRKCQKMFELEPFPTSLNFILQDFEPSNEQQITSTPVKKKYNIQKQLQSTSYQQKNMPTATKSGKKNQNKMIEQLQLLNTEYQNEIQAQNQRISLQKQGEVANFSDNQLEEIKIQLNSNKLININKQQMKVKQSQFPLKKKMISKRKTKLI